MNDWRYSCVICEKHFDKNPIEVDDDTVCSMDCAVQHQYAHQKQELQLWTPRSVLDRLTARIKQDATFVHQLRLCLRRSNHMLAFRTHDLDELCILLSNSVDWKQTLLAGVESVVATRASGFTLAFYCIKTKRISFVSIE